MDVFGNLNFGIILRFEGNPPNLVKSVHFHWWNALHPLEMEVFDIPFLGKVVTIEDVERICIDFDVLAHHQIGWVEEVVVPFWIFVFILFEEFTFDDT